MRFIHKTLPSFWHFYAALPEEIRRRSDKQYELLIRDPGIHRALSHPKRNTFVWFWVGDHDDYERLLKG